MAEAELGEWAKKLRKMPGLEDVDNMAASFYSEEDLEEMEKAAKEEKEMEQRPGEHVDDTRDDIHLDDAKEEMEMYDDVNYLEGVEEEEQEVDHEQEAYAEECGGDVDDEKQADPGEEEDEEEKAGETDGKADKATRWVADEKVKGSFVKPGKRKDPGAASLAPPTPWNGHRNRGNAGKWNSWNGGNKWKQGGWNSWKGGHKWNQGWWNRPFKAEPPWKRPRHDHEEVAEPKEKPKEKLADTKKPEEVAEPKEPPCPPPPPPAEEKQMCIPKGWTSDGKGGYYLPNQGGWVSPDGSVHPPGGGLKGKSRVRAGQKAQHQRKAAAMREKENDRETHDRALAMKLANLADKALDKLA